MSGEVMDELLNIVLQRSEAARRDSRRRAREAREWEAFAQHLQQAEYGRVAPLRPVPPRRMSS